MTIYLADLSALTQLHEGDAEEVTAFHKLRKEAFDVAHSVFDDRASSYNVNHEPFMEMTYGIVSLASEVHKRSIRLAGLVSPLRTDELREEDLARVLDTFTDLMNYASWGYAMMKIGTQKAQVIQDPLPDQLHEARQPALVDDPELVARHGMSEWDEEED